MAGSTILIIENDEQIREILERFLTESGYRVLTAADGLEGLDRIRQESYDLVILDIHLPYVSGIGLIKVVREEQAGIPIICMTGYGQYPEKIAEQEKADMVLAKPVPLKKLAENIEKMISKTK